MNEYDTQMKKYSGIIGDREVRLVPVDYSTWAVDVRIETGKRKGEYVEGYLYYDYEPALKDYNKLIEHYDIQNRTTPNRQACDHLPEG